MNKSSTLKELVKVMEKYPDSEVFRWFQKSHVGSDGQTIGDDTLYVTMGQVRKELGLCPT